MLNVIRVILRLLFFNRAHLAAENVALRQQPALLNRPGKRPRLRQSDRIFWVWLSRLWTNWRSALVIVKPATVVKWHRRGFKLYWRWKSRKTGRPMIDPEIRRLIRRMSLETPNPLYVKWADMLREADVVPLRLEMRRISTAQATSYFT